jgi:hypothetical protein
VASVSLALTEGLSVRQSDPKHDAALEHSIAGVLEASLA